MAKSPNYTVGAMSNICFFITASGLSRLLKISLVHDVCRIIVKTIQLYIPRKDFNYFSCSLKVQFYVVQYSNLLQLTLRSVLTCLCLLTLIWIDQSKTTLKLPSKSLAFATEADMIKNNKSFCRCIVLFVTKVSYLE